MRGTLAILLAGLLPLLGCSVPAGNLVALQGEGVHVGTRLSLQAQSSPLDPGEPPLAFATLEAAWIQPWTYLRAETGVLPPGILYAGGVLGAGLHWQDRIALGVHQVLARGSGLGADLTVRPLSESPWIAGASLTPSLEHRPLELEGGVPRVGSGHDLEASLGWSPVADTAGGAVAVEIGIRQEARSGGIGGWIRISGSARLFVPGQEPASKHRPLSAP